jgi:valyl-tRNA synthetase
MNGVAADPAFDPDGVRLTINRWILTELGRTERDVREAIETYRFNDAAGSLYRFVWNQLCDWYLELLKPVFNGDDEAAKRESQMTAGYVLDETYKLLHPFMPFMTEELWTETAGADGRSNLLCHAEWPAPGFADDGAADEINWLVDLVSALRSTRSEMNIPPAATAPLVVVGAGKETLERLRRHEAAIGRLARVERVEEGREAPRGSAQIVLGEATWCLPLGGLIDLQAEEARLQKAHTKAVQECERLEKKLANEKFVANADPEVVAAEREKLDGLRESQARLEMAVRRVREAL